MLNTKSTETNHLVAALKSSNIGDRKQAEADLEAMGVNAIKALIDAMQSDDQGQAWRAAQLLAKIDDSRPLRYMVRALGSQHGLVGQVAVKAIIANLSANHAGLLLTKSLLNSHYTVQVHIVSGLTTLRYYGAIEPLMLLLSTTLSEIVQYITIDALDFLAATQAIELIRIFEQSNNYHLQKRARLALKSLGNL